MSRNPGRPLSPHLTIWRWGPAMVVSILHRATGTGLAIVGGMGFVWWLLAAATSADAYATFMHYATGPLGYLFAIGLTWAFFQHMFSGLRHFVMDMGAGYELKTNKTWALVTIVASLAVTLLIWAWIIMRVKGAH